VTFLLLFPIFSFPCCISFISRSTLLLASGEYLRLLLFFAEPLLVAELLLVAERLFAGEAEVDSPGERVDGGFFVELLTVAFVFGAFFTELFFAVDLAPPFTAVVLAIS